MKYRKKTKKEKTVGVRRKSKLSVVSKVMMIKGEK